MKIATVTTAREPDRRTVDALTELLEKAKSGELSSIMFVDGYVDGLSGSGWSGVPTKDMLGEMERLKFNLCSQMAGGFEDVE